MSLFDNYPHKAEYHLAVWPAPEYLSGVVSGSPSRGDRTITIDIDISPRGDINPGYTLETDADAGTTRPYVRTRIRSYNAGTFVVAENAINWVAGKVVRVYKEIMPWSIKPRILVVGGTPVFYQDYDIPYTNQNQIVKPIVNMGPHYAGPVPSDVYYTALGSLDLQDDSLATYAWTFEGGTPSTSSLATPGYVHYSTAGPYVTKLTITNNGGASSTGYRFINIGQSVDPHCGIESLENHVDGVCTLKGWFDQAYSGPTIRAGSLVVVYGQETYGVQRYTATEPPFRTETIFVGYVKNKSVRWNSRFSRWDFEALTVTGFADALDVYDTALQYRATSNRWQWWKYLNLTMDKAVAWHLMWHTNILDIADFVPTGDTKLCKAFDVGRGGPFTAIRQAMSAANPGWIGSNYQGKIYMQLDPNLMDLDDRPDESWFTLQPSMVREEPYASDAELTPTSHVGAGGYAFSGATGTNTAYLSAAPMEAADDYGKPFEIDGLILNPGTGQEGLNKISGHLFARENNEWKGTTWPLTGNYRPFMDVFPVRKVLVNNDDPAWVNDPFYVDAVSHKYDSHTKMTLTDATLSRHTVGLPGVSIPIPVPEQPEEPPAPPPPPPPIIQPPITGNAKEVWIFAESGVYWSGDFFNGGQPTWNKVAGSMPESGLGRACITMDGTTVYLAYPQVANKGLYKCTNPKSGSPVWTDILAGQNNNGYPYELAHGNWDVGMYQNTLWCSARAMGESTFFGYHFGVYNGTSWTWSSANWNSGTSRWAYSWHNGKNFYLSLGGASFESDAWNLPHGAGVPSVAGDAGASYFTNNSSAMPIWSYSASSAVALARLTVAPYTHYLFLPYSSTIGTALSGFTLASGNIDANVNGSIQGNKVFIINRGNHDLWVGDTSGVALKTTWTGLGRVHDAAQSGGGSLVASVIASIESGSEFVRLNKDGTGAADQWEAMTGNFWSLTSGTENIIDSGLVYA